MTRQNNSSPAALRPFSFAPMRRLALLACTALLLSACGGGDFSESDTTTALTSDDTAPCE